jgi:glycosyltransferase involved in cell wall biosynthesis
LVNAFADWSRRAPFAPARLDIYGGDDKGEAGRIQARIAELGLEKSVSLRGSYWKTDLDRILGETDLVVLPSTYEGQPIVLIEAMQRGVPIVATSAGGTAELGIDNPDVIISPGTDWAAFETAAETMAARLRAGQVDSPRLHAWTEARYSHQAVANAWREALLSPETFFAAKKAGEDRA